MMPNGIGYDIDPQLPSVRKLDIQKEAGEVRHAVVANALMEVVDDIEEGAMNLQKMAEEFIVD